MTIWMDLDPLPPTASEFTPVQISEPGALKEHEHHLTDPHHECDFKFLQAKQKLISQVDAIFQKHMEGIREQQKHWASALDTFLLEAEEDWAAWGGLSANKHAFEKPQESLDSMQMGSLLSSSSGGQHSEKPDRREVKHVPSYHSVHSTDSQRVSTLAKASSHHIQRKQSAEDFSNLKKHLGGSLASDNRKTWRKELQSVVFSTPFDGCVFFVILANVLFVGVEVDFIANRPGIPVPGLFLIASYCFAAIFTLELTLRLLAIGCPFLSFSGNKDWAWNWFDVIVVMSSLVEIVADVVQTSSSNMDMVHLRIIRIIRITRLLRTLRMVRMVRFIRALRTLVHSILATLRAAIWSLLLLLIIFYGFGVGLTQAVMDYCDTLPIAEESSFAELHVRAANCQDEALLEFWGTLPRSMFTLFESVSGGISWHMVVKPLSDAGFMCVLLFVCFITFTLFAVLNVVTGLFCQSAIESAKQDKDIATMQLMASKAYNTKALEQLFSEMDKDNSGNLTLHEFQQSLENNRILAFFESLDICCNDAWALFHLLDADQEGKVDKDEFIEGCLQLRGNANAVSLAKMAYDNKIVHDMLENFMEFMEENISSLRHGTPVQPSDALVPGPCESHSSEVSVSSHDSSCIRKPVSGFERQISFKSNRRTPLVFTRQASPKNKTSGNTTRDGPYHI